MDNNNEKSEHGFVKVPSNSNNVTVDKTKKKKRILKEYMLH